MRIKASASALEIPKGAQRGDRHKLIHTDIARRGRDGAGKSERGKQHKGLLN